MFRTNDTKDRVSYSSLLLPPDGYTLHFAVGTTYSLDLEALTAVCLSLGLAGETDSALLQNPVSTLNALQKVSEKLLVFCEAGQIKMPGTPSALSLLLEKILVPVALPRGRGGRQYPAFHPKTWLLQYVNGQGEFHYRFAVLSRNLTFDRSWDVSFAMDSSKTAGTAQKTQPLMAFLDFLRAQVRPTVQNARTKRSALRTLRDALAGVCFTTGSKEFGDEFEIMPLGIGPGGCNMHQDPLFCRRFHELVAVSPFVSGSLIEHWNQSGYSLTGATRTLITRKSELSKITAGQCSEFRIYTLKDDIVDGEEAVSDDTAEKQNQDIHGKLYLRRKNSDVDLYLGSMNATQAAVNRNVEMMIRLRTKSRYYQGEALLRDLFCGAADNPQNPFELSKVTDPIPDDRLETADRLEQIIKTVCRLPMQAAVTEREGKYDVSLSISGHLPEGTLAIRPFRRNVLLPLENEMLFPQLDLLQVSEFFMLRVSDGEMAVERILMVPTTGIPADRENTIVNSVVKDKRTFVEYVAFVLEDSYLLSLLEERPAGGTGSWNNSHDSLPALYEKMLKTALEEPEKLREIGYLLRMITKEDIVPGEFRELYDTFRKTLRLK